jgi:hypothetical protein
MLRYRQVVQTVTEIGLFVGTVEGLCGEDAPDGVMESVDLLYPIEVGGRYFDEEQFEEAFPGVAEDILGDIDDDAWEEYDYDE